METYHELVEEQRSFFQTGQTKSLTFRLDALKALQTAIRANEAKLTAALHDDLRKSEFDAYATEIGIVLSEISFTLKHLKRWVRPQRVKTPLTHIGSKSRIYADPYGVALIISPWNYPFQLAVAPLVGAIAAGNCAIIKPSELTPKTSEVMAELIGRAFPQNYITVVPGGVETSQSLLAEKVDYIFFTGGVAVGKVVSAAAARHLTPVTLELGGKSPCIVHEDANLHLTAKRIAWGKFMNAGQTCVAPDYVYVHKRIQQPFIAALRKEIQSLYGTDPLENETMTRIVTDRHFERLMNYLKGVRIAIGGRADVQERIIEPTVIEDAAWTDAVMQEEIFGRILPLLTYETVDEAIAGIQHSPNPLALYLFTGRRDVQDRILQNVPFGGGCINDTIYHFTSPYLPFGGVGNSGIGAYHGKGSFDTFSHHKGVLVQTTRFDVPV